MIDVKDPKDGCDLDFSKFDDEFESRRKKKNKSLNLKRNKKNIKPTSKSGLF